MFSIKNRQFCYGVEGIERCKDFLFDVRFVFNFLLITFHSVPNVLDLRNMRKKIQEKNLKLHKNAEIAKLLLNVCSLVDIIIVVHFVCSTITLVSSHFLLLIFYVILFFICQSILRYANITGDLFS